MKITHIGMRVDGMYDVTVVFNNQEIILTLTLDKLSAQVIREKVITFQTIQLEGIMNRLNKELEQIP